MKGLSLHQRLTLLVILIVGLLLRFHNYGDWSLSNDELSALNRLHYNSFSEIMEEGVRLNDMHPPGIQAFLYIWTGIFGVSEHALRFPFVLLGIGSIYLLFLVAKTWFNTHVALITTASFTALIFPILYSQLARPYSPGLFFTLLTVYYWTNIILTKNEKTSRGNFIGFILSGAACLYTHYFSFLFIAIVGITGLFFIKGNKLLTYVSCGVVMLLLLLPAYSIFNYQLAIGGLGGSGGWLGPPSADTILLLIHYIFNESTPLLLFYTLLFLTLLFYLPKNRINGKKPMRLTALLFFLIPFIIAYFYSILKNPVYQHSIMLFSFPYLLIFIFSFLPSGFSEKKSITLSLIVLMVTGISTVAEKKYYSTQYFAVFKEPAEKTISYNKKYGAENITSIANVFFPYYIEYYHEKLNFKVPYKLYNCSSPQQLSKLNELVESSQTNYFSYIWSNTANPEEVEQIVSQHFPLLIDKTNYFNSGVRLFAKANTNEKGNLYIPIFNTLLDFDNNLSGNDSAMISEVKSHSGTNAILYTGEKEFGPTYKKPVHEINNADGSVIWIKAWIYSEQLPLQASLVLQVDEGNKTILWRGANANDYVLTTNKWYPVFLAYRFNEPLPKEAVLSIYVWNSGKTKFFVDDISVALFN